MSDNLYGEKYNYLRYDINTDSLFDSLVFTVIYKKKNFIHDLAYTTAAILCNAYFNNVIFSSTINVPKLREYRKKYDDHYNNITGYKYQVPTYKILQFVNPDVLSQVIDTHIECMINIKNAAIGNRELKSARNI